MKKIIFVMLALCLIAVSVSAETYQVTINNIIVKIVLTPYPYSPELNGTAMLTFDSKQYGPYNYFEADCYGIKYINIDKLCFLEVTEKGAEVFLYTGMILK